MPGTDFVCDGFMYGAILMLTKNNFVTQFTRITMVVSVNLGTLESFTALLSDYCQQPCLATTTGKALDAVLPMSYSNE